MLRAQDALLALGLTCVHDMGVDPTAVELYREAPGSFDLAPILWFFRLLFTQSLFVILISFLLCLVKNSA